MPDYLWLLSKVLASTYLIADTSIGANRIHNYGKKTDNRLIRRPQFNTNNVTAGKVPPRMEE